MKTTLPNMKATAKAAILCVIALVLSVSASSQSVSGANGLVFNNYSLITSNSTNNKKGAIYRFTNVLPGVNATVKIEDLVGGAQVNKIDDNSGGLGYVNSFQPEIKIPSGTGESYALMTFSFYHSDNTTPQVIDSLRATGVDIDGNLQLKEFIEVNMNGGTASYVTNSLLDINILNILGNRIRGENLLGIERNDIDTAAWGNMYTIKKSGVSTFTAKFGATTLLQTGSTARQYSLYMKGFSLPNQIVLPVKLESFTATLNNAGNKVDLKWVTSSEKNANHFAVEKSADGINFSDAGVVFAYGNTSEKMNYTFTDNVTASANKVIYYRLRSVDADGRTEYSTVRMIRIVKQTEQSIAIVTYPNPVIAELRIQIPAQWQGKQVTYELFNPNGSAAKRLNTANSSQTETIDLAKLAPGFYMVKVSCGAETATQKIIKN
jgi:hypothetical protein